MFKSPKHPLTGPGKQQQGKGTSNLNYKEIAEILGCSRETVRQTEIRALRKIRKALEDQGLTFDDLLPVNK